MCGVVLFHSNLILCLRKAMFGECGLFWDSQFFLFHEVRKCQWCNSNRIYLFSYA